MNVSELTLAEAHKKLSKKELSSVELTKACLEEIKKANSKLNAFVSVTEEAALKQAKEADERIGKGKATPLTGIPCGLKDNFCEKGVDSTACSNILKGFKPPYDATSVAKLREAGAVFVGHTNTDEFTMGASTETSAFGVTKNPWDEPYSISSRTKSLRTNGSPPIIESTRQPTDFIQSTADLAVYQDMPGRVLSN